MRPAAREPDEGRLSATRPAAGQELLQPEAEVAEPGRLHDAGRVAAVARGLRTAGISPEEAVEPNAVLSWLPDETEEQAPCGVLFCKTFSAAATAYFLGCP